MSGSGKTAAGRRPGLHDDDATTDEGDDDDDDDDI